MPLKALFDSVVVEMDVDDTIIEMTDEVAAKVYSDADKTVVDIGPEFYEPRHIIAESDLKVGDKIVPYPGAGILYEHKFVILRKHEILARVV